MNDTEQLKQLYAQANSLNEELPGDLIKKISIYGSILRITGKLHADSLKDWKMAEAKRKETIATVYTYDPEGTVKDKEYKGEVAATKFRQEEAIAEAECMRWRNAYTSTIEMMQVLKLQIKDLKEIEKGGI